MPQRVTELHCIMPINNVASVVQNGLLSYERAKKLSHSSIAMAEVQEQRDRKTVPRGLKLHQYANLYFCARNPMMYKRKVEVDSICILRFDRKVMSLPNVVLTDQNAASDYVCFYSYPEGLGKINFDLVFATSWSDTNQIEYWRKKSRKCAEVLVPYTVSPEYIRGAYCGTQRAVNSLKGSGFPHPVTINGDLFFI